ncbi:MAG TPA: histidine kinase [Anaerolineae bacterium]|nr:histidine kinase [Anaerolineae bacterium]
MAPRTARWAAWAVATIYFVLAAAGLTLQGLARAPYAQTTLPILTVLVLLVGIWVVTGAFIISRYPQHPVGWLLCAGVFFAAIDMFSAGYAAYDTYVFSGTLPGVVLALVWLKLVVLGPHGLVAFSLIILLFPDGRLPSPRWRKVAWITVGALFLFLPLQAVEPGPIDPSFLLNRTNPLGVSTSLWTFLNPLMWMAFSILVLCYGAAFVSLIVRLRSSRGDVRQQIKWLLFPAGLFVIFLLLFIIGIAKADDAIAGIGIALGQLAIAGIVIAVALAIFKYRLYDIDLIINRTLVYGMLTAITMGLYIFIVGFLGNLFQLDDRTVIAFFTTGLVAILFHPLRERLQRAVNRLFYGQRDDPMGTLSQLGQRLEVAIAPEEVLHTLAETIGQTLKLPYVAISLRSGDKFKVAAKSGDEVADAIGIPLNYQGQTVGQLIAGLRAPGESFSKADKQLLANIAHQAAPAAYAVQLTEDLRQSRVRLVTTREEERRRLRRDLHDGLGPILASQGLKMAAVSQLLQDDPAKSRQLLEELAVQNQATVAEIRRLVYELRPAALDHLGLVAAVRDYASGLKGGAQDSPRLKTDVHAPVGGLPLLPAAIEVAAYRISIEALTNVARHARARQAKVSFALNAANHTRSLHLEIMDDGVGMQEGQRAGIGLISMRERAEEIGGNLLIESFAGRGTRVVANLPLVDVK